MDSRDIIQEPKKIEGNKFLEEIYEMQKGLLERYIGIEGLPQYPIDINTKASQTLLKDFTSRIVEELSEGYESFQLVSECFEKNQAKIIREGGDTPEYVEILNHLQNANEENADAIHFFIELLIYANIQPEDIKSYIIKEYKDYYERWGYYGKFFGNNEDSENILSLAMGVGHQLLADSGYIEKKYPGNIKNLLKEYREMSPNNHLIDGFNEKLMLGGRMYNLDDYSLQYPFMLWKITHHLNIARNFLKNKPWKQSQVMTQELKYQAELVKAFIYFCGYLQWIDMCSEDVFYIYFKKNYINRFRQKSNY